MSFVTQPWFPTTVERHGDLEGDGWGQDEARGMRWGRLTMPPTRAEQTHPFGERKWRRPASRRLQTGCEGSDHGSGPPAGSWAPARPQA